MAKRVTDLGEAIASRSRKEAAPPEPEKRRPRLAERLVELAPLARAPIVPDVAEQSREPPDLALSSLSSAPRTSVGSPGSVTPETTSRALVVQTMPPPARALVTPIVRYDEQPRGSAPSPLADLHLPEGRGTTGFLVGLSIATGVGIVLYAWLI